MKHEVVFKQILNNLYNLHKLETENALSGGIEQAVTTSLISLYGILSGCSTSFDSQIQQEMAQMQLPCNCSAVKPSLNELLCMCKVNQKSLCSLCSEEEVAYLICLYITKIWLKKQPDGNNAIQKNTEEFMKTSASLCQNYNCKNQKICLKLNGVKFLLSFFYFYLFLILEKYGLIEDDYKPWKEELVNNWIYLPLEGTVNLVYFNYLITTDKAEFSKAIVCNDGLFKDNEISQYDCGFSANSSKQINLSSKELIALLDPSLEKSCKINNDLLKKYIKYPCKWLFCFHILSEEELPDEKTLKIIKALHDVQNHYSIYKINSYKNDNHWSENNNPYKILANIDECNFSVRGILYKSIFGNVSTWIKSTIFRDLPLSTIWDLERMHDTVMDHLGNFAAYAGNVWFTDKNTNDKDKEKLLTDIKAEIDNYQFVEKNIDDFKSNSLVQIVAWLFLAEIYSYLKTEVVMSEYMNSNSQAINNSYDYFSDKIPSDLNVVFKDLSICCNNGNGDFDKINQTLEYFYKMHIIFNEENIPDLIENTKSAMLNFFADTLLFIKGPQHCSLRQFLAVSLVLVKTKKGSTIFPKISEFKHYGHTTQRLSAYEYLTDPTWGYNLKQVLFASKLFEQQNHSFIQTSRFDLYHNLVTTAYKKIMDYLNEKIPIIKDGIKSNAEKNEKTLTTKLTPYELLMSVYDITVNLFDKLLDEMP